jgi:integrase
MTEDLKKARRPRGEGGVYFNEKRGRYIAEKIVGYDGRGNPIRKTASGATETAALKALRERVRKYEAGIVQGAERYTVGQAVEDWLKYARTEVGERTERNNRDFYENHIKPHLGGRRVKDLRPVEVEKWLHELAPNLGRSALKQALSVLRRSIDRAMALGLAERNVTTLVQPPKGRAGRPSKSLTLEQARAIIESPTARAHWMYPYIVVSLTTGVRTEEARAMRWDHVHLTPENDAAPHVWVWRSVRRGNDTKTPKSRRTLALPGIAVRAFERQWAWQDDRRRAAGDSWKSSGLVFTTGVGTTLRPENVLRDFRIALRGVPGIDPEDWTPRELRHSFVSLLSASEVPIEEVSRLVGHSDIATTENVYRHELRPVMQTGAKAMDTVFG